MKIAIAVESSEMQVAKRMGRAPWFAIYELDGDHSTLLELAENEHAKEHHGGGGHHHEDHNETEVHHHQQHLAPLKGISAILARAVGPNMKDALAREGIAVYRLPLSAGKTAPELVDYFIRNNQNLEQYKII